MCAEADEQKCSKSFWGIFRCDHSCASAWCTEIDRQVDSYRQAGRQTERQSDRPIGKADRQTDMRCEIKAEREREVLFATLIYVQSMFSMPIKHHEICI